MSRPKQNASGAPAWHGPPSLSRLAKALIALQVVWLGATLPLYPVYGLHVVGFSAFLERSAPMFAVVIAIFLVYRYLRGGREAWVVSEVFLAVLVMLVFTNVGSPSQYLAVAIGMPLIDPWLSAADRALGVSVRELTAWTAQYPELTYALRLAYYSLLPQIAAVLVYLGLVKRDLDRVWEYAFHFHFCLLVALICSAVFPAECVFTYEGFDSLLDQARFIRQFEGFRSGALTAIDWGDLEGMISMPSFHVAAGLMMVWAVRADRWVLAFVGPLNLAMIAATVLCGAHYFVDLVATCALFALSLLAWRCYFRALSVHGSA